MRIRNYQPGDEVPQAEIYNEAARDLPKFKPASAAEVTRRCAASDFDPATRLYAEDAGNVVGYAVYHPNGRVSYPWCRRGHEAAAEPLFDALQKAMSQRGIRRAFAAYRGDWRAQLAYLADHGFRPAREMLNFVLDTADMPTGLLSKPNGTEAARPEDVPAILELVGPVSRAGSVEALTRHLFANPYFGSDAVFVIRGPDGAPVAAAVIVVNSAYAHPRAVDASMPCFRLGAFGAEDMQTKRINGLFSFVARDDVNLVPLSLALLDQAAGRIERVGLGSLAAQVASDAVHLVGVYDRYFQRQGSFPIVERNL